MASLENRLQKLEESAGLIPALRFHSNGCRVCVARDYARAALDEWDREHGFYLEPVSEDVLTLHCWTCGAEYKLDATAFSEDFKKWLARTREDIERMSKEDAVKGFAWEEEEIKARWQKLFGNDLSPLYTRSEVYRTALEKAGGGKPVTPSDYSLIMNEAKRRFGDNLRPSIIDEI